MTPRLAHAIVLVLVLAVAPLANAASQADSPPNPRKLNPPPGVPVPETVRLELQSGVAELGRQIDNLGEALRAKPQLSRLIPDVQIYYNAVRYALEDDIFNSTNQFAVARVLLQHGAERAKQLAAGHVPWNTKSGLLEVAKELESRSTNRNAPALTHVPVARGYLSRIDGSVQPYGILVPVAYLRGDDHPRRLDFWLHGRGDNLNEIAFIEGRQRPGSEFLPEDTFILHPYGRFMNAFKFAGETDVFEALDHAATQYPIDRDKLAMRGFSMGGAGAWHLGAHHADQFAAINPGAGFVDVKNYQKLGTRLGTIPWWEQALWNFYDPLASPINLMNSTLVAYSGEEDAQKAAADLMETALLKEGIKMTHIIGPKTGHKYETEARKKVAALVDEATQRGINHTLKKVSLVTHTLRFNRAHWLRVDSLEEHWKPARVDATLVTQVTPTRIEITTQNVDALSVEVVPAGPVGRRARLVIDGQDLGERNAVFSNPPPGLPASWWKFSATKTAGKWSERGSFANSHLTKRHNLQGPIDDAFMDSFMMARPTGVALNETEAKWVQSELAEAAFHWRRYFRGEPRMKDDTAVTAEDLQKHHLILWGDPSSNALLGRIADGLPIRWTRDAILVGAKKYDTSKHVPVLIFPNPLNPERYIVINSGFTFPQFAAASNSLQTPKLPDWAILDLSVPLADRIAGKGVVAANFFDDNWELKPMDR